MRRYTEGYICPKCKRQAVSAAFKEITVGLRLIKAVYKCEKGHTWSKDIYHVPHDPAKDKEIETRIQKITKEKPLT